VKEEGDEQVMHRIVPIDGCEDITGGHLLCKRAEVDEKFLMCFQ